MKIGIPKELQDNRIAMVPATMKKITSEQITFLVERDAGLAASIPNADFEKVATITDRSSLLSQAEYAPWLCRYSKSFILS